MHEQSVEEEIKNLLSGEKSTEFIGS